MDSEKALEMLLQSILGELREMRHEIGAIKCQRSACLGECGTLFVLKKDLKVEVLQVLDEWNIARFNNVNRWAGLFRNLREIFPWIVIVGYALRRMGFISVPLGD